MQLFCWGCRQKSEMFMLKNHFVFFNLICKFLPRGLSTVLYQNTCTKQFISYFHILDLIIMFLSQHKINIYGNFMFLSFYF